MYSFQQPWRPPPEAAEEPKPKNTKEKRARKPKPPAAAAAAAPPLALDVRLEPPIASRLTEATEPTSLPAPSTLPSSRLTEAQQHDVAGRMSEVGGQ